MSDMADALQIPSDRLAKLEARMESNVSDQRSADPNTNSDVPRKRRRKPDAPLHREPAAQSSGSSKGAGKSQRSKSRTRKEEVKGANRVDPQSSRSLTASGTTSGAAWSAEGFQGGSSSTLGYSHEHHAPSWSADPASTSSSTADNNSRESQRQGLPQHSSSGGGQKAAPTPGEQFYSGLPSQFQQRGIDPPLASDRSASSLSGTAPSNTRSAPGTMFFGGNGGPASGSHAFAAGFSESAALARSMSAINRPTSPAIPRDGPVPRQKFLELQNEARRLRYELDATKRSASGLEHQVTMLSEELKKSREANAEVEKRHTVRSASARSTLERILREHMRHEILASRKDLSERQFRLGRLVTRRTGVGSVMEMWEDGWSFRELRGKQAQLERQREELERMKKSISKETRKGRATAKRGTTSVGRDGGREDPGTSSSAGSFYQSSQPWFDDREEAGTPLSGGLSDDNSQPGNDMPPPPGADTSNFDLIATEEAVKVQINQIRKKETQLKEEAKALLAEKAMLLKEIQRVRAEENSRFKHRPVLSERYLLLNILGKGGFSEVWRAFDLIDIREVAVKIHQLSSTWPEERKASYIRHATREYAIHKVLIHPRVVRLFDVFEIDANSFATVLEICRGTDLDRYLKQNTTLSEREARSIVIQVLSALRYLSGGGDDADRRGPRIIHYDLKPANILLDESNAVKVTDFGLSKVLDMGPDGDVTSMELTSQGAGTYWYLPPECFQTGGAPPRISSKVDVWSLGVIFYQMLYGKRPFGENMSQERIQAEKVILHANQVEFPAKPVVSAEAKTFIRRCLTPRQDLRPDVTQISQDPYLYKKMTSKQ